jgi:excisionase family DNA binding protein
MEEQERLYTISDVARLTGITPRRARELLKNSAIKGTRVGGQWLFSESEIEALLCSERMLKQTAADNNDDVRDFINGENTDLSGKLQICVIADMFADKKDEARIIAERVSGIISDGEFEKGEGRQSFSYEYSEEEKRARFTAVGGYSFVSEVLKGLR